jgi:hypothetical protein
MGPVRLGPPFARVPPLPFLSRTQVVRPERHASSSQPD